jgi:DNA primase
VIAERSVQAVRSGADCLKEAQRHTQMKKAGRQWVGLSPFATEKSPSFYVNPDKNVWFCYSSGKGGDVIGLVQKLEGMEFAEAVEQLGERYHIKVEQAAGGKPGVDKSLRAGVRRAQEIAWTWWRECWGKTPGAREWWGKARGFPEKLAEDWGLGFAPADDRGELAKRLFAELTPEMVEGAGLLVDARPGHTRRARLRGRAVLPIRGAGGVILGFTGRVLGGDLAPLATDPTREAKYVNSPETCLFSKGQTLFGLEEARPLASAADELWLVEGQLDAIRCQADGLPAVATGGTAVTPEQMRRARRHAARLVVWMDGDSAGQKSIVRLLPLALAEGFDVRIVGTPGGAKDPDEWLRDHPKKWPRPQDGLGPMPWLAARVRERAGWGTASRAAAFEELAAVADAAESATARAALREEAARLLGLALPRMTNDECRMTKDEPQSARSGPSSWEFAVLVALASSPIHAMLWAQKVPPEWSRSETPAGSLLGKALGRIEVGEPWGLLTEVAEGDEEQRLATEAEVMGASLGREAAADLAEGALKRRARRVVSLPI